MRDVLDDDVSRSELPDDSLELIPETGALAGKSRSVSRDGQILTGGILRR